VSAVAEDAGTRGERAERRGARLAGRARRLRTRATANPERWLLVLGGMFVVLGVVVVTLGWLGASETHVVFEQIPYLISGGLLGLGFIFIGTFVYFAYWLTLVVRENRELRRQIVAERREMQAAQAELVEAVRALTEKPAPRSAPKSAPKSAPRRRTSR
jgi:hypothetical protein